MRFKTTQDAQSPIAISQTAHGTTQAQDADPIQVIALEESAFVVALCRPPDRVQSGGIAIRIANGGYCQGGVGSTVKGYIKVVNIDPDHPENNVDLTDPLALFDFNDATQFAPATGTVLRLGKAINGLTSPAGDLVGLVYYETGLPGGDDVRPYIHVLGWPLLTVDPAEF